MTDHDAEDREAQEEARREHASDLADTARAEALADERDAARRRLADLEARDAVTVSEREELDELRDRFGDAAQPAELRDAAEREQRAAEAAELRSYPVQPGELGPVEVHHHSEPIGGLAAGVRARIRSTVEALDQPLEAAELRDAGIAIAALSASLEDLEREDGVIRASRAAVERWVRDLEELLAVLGEPAEGGDRDVARRYWSVREGILDELVDHLGQRRVGELQRDGLLRAIEDLRDRLRDAQDEARTASRAVDRALERERRRIAESVSACELLLRGRDTPRELIASAREALERLAEELRA